MKLKQGRHYMKTFLVNRIENAFFRVSHLRRLNIRKTKNRPFNKITALVWLHQRYGIWMVYEVPKQGLSLNQRQDCGAAFLSICAPARRALLSDELENDFEDKRSASFSLLFSVNDC